MKLNQFLGKIVQKQDQQIMVHGLTIRGKHLVLVCIMEDLGDEYIVLNGKHEKLIQPKNLLMIKDQQLDVK